MYELIIRRRAARYFRRLPQNLQDRIRNALQQLRTSALQTPGIKKMFGEWVGYYRLRVGHIRIIFWIEENEKTIYVDEIGTRGDIY